jgi:CRISPR system Cascade subunit CasC
MHFLNAHILFGFPYGSPNRDDTGAPKTMPVGGVTRARISSQAAKRARRARYETSIDGDRSARSTQLAEHIATDARAILVAAGHDDDDTLTKTIRSESRKRVRGLYTDKDDKSDGQAEPSDADEKKDTLVWLAEAEQSRLVQAVVHAVDGQVDLEDFITPGRTESLTIAAFGRMFANRPDLQTEAAVQMAHAFTTHAASIEIDYFTAADDLRTQDAGAGHLGIQQYTGGVFYQYLNLDRDQLLQTWIAPQAPLDRTRLVELFMQLFCAQATGHSTNAAHESLPIAVLLEESRHPASYAAAFEAPVAARDGFTVPSIERLAQEHSRCRTQAPSWFGRSWATDDQFGTDATITTLEELAAAAADWVLEAQAEV